MGPNFPAAGRPAGGTLTRVQAPCRSSLPGLLYGFEGSRAAGDLLSSAGPSQCRQQIWFFARTRSKRVSVLAG